MGKRKVRNHELERYSRGRLQMTLSQWVVNSLDEDYAFDFEVRPTEDLEANKRNQPGEMVLPTPFYVQLKAAEGFDDPESVWQDFETEYLIDDCLQASIPVVLVICDHSQEELYWCVLQRYCWDVLDAADKDWRDQETVRVRIDRRPLADAIALGQLRSTLGGVEHRITTRQRVAAARRGSLRHPIRMHVASAADVHEYKREIVEEAASLVDAGQREQARRKLLEVCQMAEAGEPTLHAYRQLLELRELDDPSIAFAKIRFALEGAQLADQHDHEDVIEELRNHYEAAWDQLEETFIGARYRGPSGLSIRILDVQRMQLLDGNDAEMTAVVQHGVDLSDLQASTIAISDEYERVGSGSSPDPHEQVCAERDHEFDTDVLREAPIAAICETCGFSWDTIQHWFSQDVPKVCDSCGMIVYERGTEMEVPGPGDQRYCKDCRR